MAAPDRLKLLFGPYQTLRFRYGQPAFCEARGELTVCGVTDARIPWPVGKRGRVRSLVVYRGAALDGMVRSAPKADKTSP